MKNKILIRIRDFLDFIFDILILLFFFILMFFAVPFFWFELKYDQEIKFLSELKKTQRTEILNFYNAGCFSRISINLGLHNAWITDNAYHDSIVPAFNDLVNLILINNRRCNLGTIGKNLFYCTGWIFNITDNKGLLSLLKV